MLILTIEKNVFLITMAIYFARIFFASSEYAANWPGTIDGAIQVGENTAYEILWRIRPQALSFPEMSNIKYLFLSYT